MFANVPGFEKIAASGERKYLKKPEILGFLKRSNDIYPFFVHSQLVAHLWPRLNKSVSLETASAVICNRS